MVEGPRTTTVQILGHEYRIRSEESAEFVNEVAVHVDSVMRGISSRMSAGTTSQVAVLAALNIAEELFRERRDSGNGHDASETEERLRAMIERLSEITGSGVRRGQRVAARAGSRG